jgi:hypothetical protein
MGVKKMLVTEGEDARIKNGRKDRIEGAIREARETREQFRVLKGKYEEVKGIILKGEKERGLEKRMRDIERMLSLLKKEIEGIEIIRD